MTQDKHIILGVHLHDRKKQAQGIQAVFSEYGCNIKTRLGMHEASTAECAINGLIILEMTGEDSRINGMVSALKKFDGVDVQQMTFNHK